MYDGIVSLPDDHPQAASVLLETKTTHGPAEQEIPEVKLGSEKGAERKDRTQIPEEASNADNADPGPKVAAEPAVDTGDAAEPAISAEDSTPRQPEAQSDPNRPSSFAEKSSSVVSEVAAETPAAAVAGVTTLENALGTGEAVETKASEDENAGTPTKTEPGESPVKEGVSESATPAAGDTAEKESKPTVTESTPALSAPEESKTADPATEPIAAVKTTYKTPLIQDRS